MPTIPTEFEDIAREFGHVALPKTGVEASRVMRLRLAFDRSQEEGISASVALMNDALDSEDADAIGRTLVVVWNVCYQRNGQALMHAQEQYIHVLKAFLIQSDTHVNFQGKLIRALGSASVNLFVPGAKDALSISDLEERLRKVADSGGLNVEHELKSRLFQTDTRRKIAGTVAQPLSRRLTSANHPEHPDVKPMSLEIDDAERGKLSHVGIPSTDSLFAYHVFHNGNQVNIDLCTDFVHRAAQHDALSEFLRLCIKTTAFLIELKMASSSRVEELLVVILQIVMKHYGEKAAPILHSLRVNSKLLDAADAKRLAMERETAHDVQAKTSDTTPHLPTLVMSRDGEKKEKKIPTDFLERLNIKLADGETVRLKGNLARCKVLSRILLSGSQDADDAAVKSGYKEQSFAFHADHCPGDYGRAIYEFIQLMQAVINDEGSVTHFMETWQLARDAARHLLKQRKAKEMLGGASVPSGALLNAEQAERALSILAEAQKHPENAMRYVISALEIVIRAMSPDEM